MDFSSRQTICLLIVVLSSFIGSAIAGCNVLEALGELDNGAYAPNTSYVEVGEHVSAVCDSGFYIAGCNRLTCTASGTFTPSQLFCSGVDECRDTSIQDDTDEYSLESSYFYGNDEVECDSDTDLHSLPVHNCHENARCYDTWGSFECLCDGDYVGDGVNNCEYDPPECEILPAPEHGFIRSNTSRITTFECNEGYRLKGSRERGCSRDIGWNGIQPDCIKTGCGNPGKPINGFKIGSSYEPGNRVTFGCVSEYTLEGSETRVCTEEKYWSGWQPLCKAPKTLGDIAGDIRRDFIDKFELFTDSSKGRTAQGRLSSRNSVGLDLVFAFDKSSSVGRINFQKGLNFTKALIEEFGVNYTRSGGTRVAVVSFASKANIEFNYGDDVDTEDEVFAKLDAMENTLGGGTAMKEALENIVIDIIPNMRNNSKRALFIITDGHANTADPVGLAKDLRDKKDFEIFAIGIGNDIDREQIRTVASPPYTSHVFLINTFDDLAAITAVIAEKRTDYTKCGVSGDWELPEGDSRGSKLNAWPWIAHIYRDVENFGTYGFYCEGALICEQWVVVAASCLDGNPRFDEPEVVPMEMLRVEFGKHNYIKNEGCEQNATVIEIHRPPSYNNVSLDSDIALLKLDHPLVLVNCIRTICLPTDGDRLNFFPGTKDRCVQAGWGSANLWEQQEEDAFPRFPNKFTPNQVVMPLVGEVTCGKHSPGVELSKDILCAGKWKKATDECTGQVGTPLVCRRDDDTWAMMGVLFDGSRCETVYPFYGYSYFTKVYNYVTWINNITVNCHDAHVRKSFGGFN